MITQFHSLRKVNCLQSPPKENIHLKKGKVLRIQGSQINSRGSPILPMKLVKSGPSPVAPCVATSWTFPTGLGPLLTNFIGAQIDL